MQTRRAIIRGGVVGILAVTCSVAWAAPVHASRTVGRPRAEMAFIPNRGQFDESVHFFARGAGYDVYLTTNGPVLALREAVPTAVSAEDDSNRHARRKFRIELPHSRLESVRGEGQLTGHTNFLVGRDPRAWHEKLPRYGRVRYEEAWPGIGVVFYGNAGRLEYDFVVAPGVSADPIAVAFPDATEVTLLAGRGLHYVVGDYQGLQYAPIVYQEGGGECTSITARYVAAGTHAFGVELDAYRPDLPLVVDPVFTYSRYFGGHGNDFGTDIGLDGTGHIYVVGNTNSPSAFPLANPIQDTIAGDQDIFISKLAPSGDQLVYSTYLGGIDDEFAEGVAITESGTAWVAGWTNSEDFPLANATDPTLNDGVDLLSRDGFLAKLSPTGGLDYASYFGGSSTDEIFGVDVGGDGSVYVTGQTTSKDLPTSSGLSPTCNLNPNTGSCHDAFVAKLDSDGAVQYATYLGGSLSTTEVGCSIAVDGLGQVHVVGNTVADDFPTQNAFQPTRKGNKDFFISKLDATGSTLVYSTYLGGTDGDGDTCTGLGLDGSGNVYVTSRTASNDLPTPGGLRPFFSGGTDGYVAKISSGGQLLYGTYLGGTSSDSPQDIFVASDGSTFVTGWTASKDFPLVDATQPECALSSSNNCFDVFVTQLASDGSALVYSTYIGGQNNDEGHGIIAKGSTIFLTGHTVSTDFPEATVFPGGSGSGIDAIVLTIDGSSPTTTLPSSGDPGDVNGDGSVTATDALIALKAAVGSLACELCLCDVDDSGTITVTDALAILKVAIGQAVVLTPPLCGA